MKKIIRLICLIIICSGSIFIFQCKKDQQQQHLIKKDSLNAPLFKSNDSIILMGEDESFALIEIIKIDSLQYYYTTDGTDPGKTSPAYTDGIKLTEGSYTVKVKAFYQTIESPPTIRHFTVSYIYPVNLSGVLTKTTYDHPLAIEMTNYNSNLEYTSLLNDSSVEISQPLNVNNPGYYNLKIVSKNGQHQRMDSVIFVILDPSRGETEWGLTTWVPVHFKPDQLASETVKIIYSANYIKGLNMPFVFEVIENNSIKPLYVGVSNSVNDKSFNIKRGIGSINIDISQNVNSVQFNCANKSIALPLSVEEPSWMIINGTINSMSPGKNARIHIDANLIISQNDTLFIDEGSIVKVDEAIDIYNYGTILIHGSEDNPVIITCSDPAGFWGGFLSQGPGNKMEISNAILSQSGYHDSPSYNWGHAQRQAMFYLDETEFFLSNSYMLDNIGQVFYSLNATLNITNSIVQRAKTGGQQNFSNVTIDHCIFSDFPDDSDRFLDLDNDAIYINGCDVNVTNSTFMFAKDDGFDTGENNGGTVVVDNCRFEANFHEGIAMSSQAPSIKHHIITNCTFYNCGQGIELGFSSPNHTVDINNCLVTGNGIGIRYGDNYDWSVVDGWMNVANTRSVNNLNKDVWNMVRQLWLPKIDHLKFTNCEVSRPVEGYPELKIVN